MVSCDRSTPLERVAQARCDHPVDNIDTLPESNERTNESPILEGDEPSLLITTPTTKRILQIGFLNGYDDHLGLLHSSTKPDSSLSALSIFKL